MDGSGRRLTSWQPRAPVLRLSAMAGLFDVLGVVWPRDLPAWRAAPLPASRAAVLRVLAMHARDRAQAVFDNAHLEGNPLTFSEVLTLQAGVTVGGRRVGDAQQVLALLAAHAELAALVRAGAFGLDKPTFDRLHGVVARDEARTPGRFRGEGDKGEVETERARHGAPGALPSQPVSHPAPRVRLADGLWQATRSTEPGAGALKRLFGQGVAVLAAEVPHPVERALAFLLFAARARFYERGNMRAARLMASGVLLSHGLPALRVPAVRQGEHAAALGPLLREGDGAAMMRLLVTCQEADERSGEPR